MEAFSAPIELTRSELVAVTGGSTVKAGPMIVNLNIQVAAGNGVADGVGNIVWGNAVIGVGDGAGNGGTTIIG